jgi:Kdo2-lipid IVA lauroyltransferase/acyltransferase
MKKEFSSFLSGITFRMLVFLLQITPYRMMYFLSEGLAFILLKGIGYRKSVVMDNLIAAGIPTKDELLGKIYLNLSDIILESFKSFSMGKRDVEKRHRIINPEFLQSYFNEGKSLIVTTGHLANWEWGSLSAGFQLPFRIIGFYKPLKNKTINRLIAKSRSKYGTVLAPISKTSLTFEENKGAVCLYVMVADQSPSKPDLAIWVDFMGSETAFLHGPEKHARLNNYPVVFCEMRRIKRGFYEVEFSKLCEDPAATLPGEITAIYAEKLEKVIRNTPENWLWTHRRRKHKRTMPISDKLSV